MKKINFVNGTTIDGASTFNQMQDNVEEVFNGEESMGSIVVGDISCKNLLENINSVGSVTTNGITFTTNKDKSITINGTATAQAKYYVKTSDIPLILDSTKTYYLSGADTTNNINIEWGLDTGIKYNYGVITGVSSIGNVMVFVPKNNTVNNVTIYPQVEPGNKMTPYTPHKEFSNKQIYSTNEQVIGTWIDGKTLYRKVINLNMPNGLTERFNSYDTGLNNVTVRKIYGVMYVYGNVFPLPIHNLINGESCLISTQNGGEHINIELNCDYSNYNADIIIEYTK